jgi:hypothetical protein
MTADPIPAGLALLASVPRIAVFGGVYANPHALDAVLADARRRGCGELFCLGDLGGFGADCDGVWPRLLEALRQADGTLPEAFHCAV